MRHRQGILLFWNLWSGIMLLDERSSRIENIDFSDNAAWGSTGTWWLHITIIKDYNPGSSSPPSTNSEPKGYFRRRTIENSVVMCRNTCCSCCKIYSIWINILTDISGFTFKKYKRRKKEVPCDEDFYSFPKRYLCRASPKWKLWRRRTYHFIT